VVVSVVHLLKDAYSGVKLLDKRPVEQITAFLFANGGNEDPKPLLSNKNKSFKGSGVYGQGFTFDDSGTSDEFTPGIPSPIATMERLIAEDPKNAEVIFPYIGGEEMNSNPTHAHHRYVVDFRERSEAECRKEWPELMLLLDKKVFPERTRKKPNGQFALRDPLPRRWWQHGDRRPALYTAIAMLGRVLAIPCVSNTLAFASIQTGIVFSHKLIILPFADFSALALMESRAHEYWARAFASSMKDDLNYSPSDCFETFPFPTALLNSTATDPTHAATRQCLEDIGERYHQFRAELMVANNEGLTSTYNRFHDPAETSSGLLELRRLHGEMDQAVLAAYGWSDVSTACGFGLDYLDTEEDAQLPDELQERIDSGELFFWDANDALDFQGQLQAYGAITGRRKLPWRYRWPDAVRDDVLARLLALNAERYEEEMALGLHSKGARPAAGAKRGRKPKAAAAATPLPAFQLEPEPLQIGLDLSGGR
jgi:hypothetical protein